MFMDKLDQIIAWLKQVKANEVATFDDDVAESGPFTKRDLALCYDEVIAIVKAVKDGQQII